MNSGRVSLVVAVTAVTAIAARPGSAHAQLAHDLPPAAIIETGEHVHHARGFGFGIGTQLEAATTAVGQDPASYQGVGLHAHVHAGPIALAVHATTYRLETPDDIYVGIGDVHVAPWLRLVNRPAMAVGVGLPVGLPTGSDDHGLGMGHVMLMPTAYLALRRGELDAVMTAGYHHALESGGHGHGHQGPIVAPMSNRELTSSGRATWWLAPAVGALGEVGIAVPIVDGADVRVAAGLGARWRRGRYDVHVVVQLGLAGDPFIARGVIELHVMP